MRERYLKIKPNVLIAARGSRKPAHVAAAIGVTRQLFYRYENALADPPESVVRRWCSELQVPLLEALAPENDKIFAKSAI